jgi:hypothetical protein
MRCWFPKVGSWHAQGHVIGTHSLQHSMSNQYSTTELQRKTEGQGIKPTGSMDCFTKNTNPWQNNKSSLEPIALYSVRHHLCHRRNRKHNYVTYIPKLHWVRLFCSRVHMHPLFEMHFWYIWKHQKIEKKKFCVHVHVLCAYKIVFNKSQIFIWSL